MLDHRSQYELLQEHSFLLRLLFLYRFSYTINFTTLSFSVFVHDGFLKKIRGNQRRFPPKYIENTFWAIQGTFRCLDSKRRYDLNFVSVRSS